MNRIAHRALFDSEREGDAVDGLRVVSEEQRPEQAPRIHRGPMLAVVVVPPSRQRFEPMHLVEPRAVVDELVEGVVADGQHLPLRLHCVACGHVR